MDKRPDDFCGRPIEQQIQKLNNPEQPGTDNCLPFPIELLRIVPTTPSPNRLSNTRSDSRVKSLHVFSSALPVVRDKSHNLQPSPEPSTSRKDPLPNSHSQSLTPIQQFNNNSWKNLNKELKYNHSQPHHLHPQSVFGTRTRQGYKL